MENLSLGIRPDCRDHRHVNRTKAFEISKNPRFGRIVAVLSSSATTEENLAPAGCFVEVAGDIEYVHLRQRTKPRLNVIYTVGEQVAAERGKIFRRRSYYPVPER